MGEDMAFGQEEGHLATCHHGRDPVGTSVGVRAGGCLVILGTMLLHTMCHMLGLLLNIGTHHTTLTLTTGGENLN